ncbi:hypothetical protein B7J41_23975, partial [Salmonella enterica]|nr:hypothetical protein [Salmonella enterica]
EIGDLFINIIVHISLYFWHFKNLIRNLNLSDYQESHVNRPFILLESTWIHQLHTGESVIPNLRIRIQIRILKFVLI